MSLAKLASQLVVCLTILILCFCRTEALYGNKTFGMAGIFDIFTSKEGEKINPQIGIHFLEAYRFALEEINRNDSILRGFKFRKDVLTTENWSELMRNIFSSFLMGKSPAAVGPYSSLHAVSLSSFSGGFRYPFVSYAVSSDELVHHEDSYFFRTVPTDSFRVIATVELVKRLGWDDVSIISSYAQNGEKMAKTFITKMSKFHICYFEHITLVNQAKKKDYRQAIKKAATFERAKGLILFTSLTDSAGLLTELKELNLTNRFYILSATGMTNYVEATSGNEASLDGSISLEYTTKEVPKFREHFLKLNLTSRKSTKFRLFWEQTFGCKTSPSSSKQNNKKNCSGLEKLRPGKGYYPNTPIQSVIDSVYALALAYKHVIEKRCRENRYCDWRPSQSYYYIKLFTNFLQANMFIDHTLNMSNPITKSDPYLVEYDILNYVKSNYGYENKKIGQWSLQRNGHSKSGADYLWSNETGTLVFNASRVRWRGNMRNVASSCRRPCPKGHISHFSPGLRQKCCWQCIPCQHNEITDNNICKPCPRVSKPNSQLKLCVAIPRRLFKSHPDSFKAARVYITLSALGILATIFVAIVFIKNNNNRIVRASGRDLCYFILAGISLGFVVPFTYHVEPSTQVCTIRNIMLGMALCMCYSPLFLKTNRIYRIFQNAQSSAAMPPLVSPQSQLVIIFSILCVQALLGISWGLSNSSNILQRYIPESRDYIFWYCNEDTAHLLLNLLLSVVFMICCTWYAFKARNLPENYNESKYIGITLYITCICWAVFLPAFFISDPHKSFVRMHLMCIIAILVAYLNLIGLFGQKIKLLLFPSLVDQGAVQHQQARFRPEQNIPDVEMKPDKVDALTQTEDVDANTLFNDISD